MNKKIDELEQDIKTLENEKTISIKGRKSDNFAWKKKLNIQINLYNDLKEEFNLLDMRYEQLASTGDPKIRILTENKLLKEKVKDLENELNKYSSEGNDSKKEEIDTYNL